MNQSLWEIPAGTVDGKESPYVCARRECEEETGFKPKKLITLGTFVTAPAGDDETVYLYLAQDLTHVGTKHDLDEEITLKIFSVAQIKQMLKKGIIRDAKSIIGFYRFFETLKV